MLSNTISPLWRLNKLSENVYVVIAVLLNYQQFCMYTKSLYIL